MTEGEGSRVGWVERVALGVVLVVALEGTVRLDGLIRFGTPLVSPFHEQSQLFVRDADGMHGRPNARFEKWVLNGSGMRGPDVTVSRPAGTFRVIAVGASESFGLYESPGREYPRQLEDSLEAMRRDGRCRCGGIARFEVLNAAMLGMTLPTVVQDVRIRLRRYAADAIVLYPTPPAYLSDDVPVAARPDSLANPGQVPWSDWVYPRALQRGREQAKQLLPGFVKDYLRRREIAIVAARHPAAWRFESVPAPRLDAFEADMRAAVGAIHEVHATAVLVSHANAFAPGAPRDPVLLNQWVRFYPRANGEVIVDFADRAASLVARVAADSAVPYVDWHADAHRHPVTVFRDFSHFSDAGAALVAQLIARSLVAHVDGRP